MKAKDLKALRTEHKRTQQEVAVAANISLRQYQNYEAGNTDITEKVKDELIRAIHENKKRETFTEPGSDSVRIIKSEKDLYLEVLRQNAVIQTLLEAVAVLWGRHRNLTDFEALRELRQKEKEWLKDQPKKM